LYPSHNTVMVIEDDETGTSCNMQEETKRFICNFWWKTSRKEIT